MEDQPQCACMERVAFFIMLFTTHTGAIPEELGKLSALKRLNLGENNLSGEHRCATSTWVGFVSKCVAWNTVLHLTRRYGRHKGTESSSGALSPSCGGIEPASGNILQTRYDMFCPLLLKAPSRPRIGVKDAVHDFFLS